MKPLPFPSTNALQNTNTPGLSETVKAHLKLYFSTHGETLPRNLYQSVLQEVEKGLFEETLSFVEGNKQQAAHVLGIHRNTLREKMKKYL